MVPFNHLKSWAGQSGKEHARASCPIQIIFLRSLQEDVCKNTMVTRLESVVRMILTHLTLRQISFFLKLMLTNLLRDDPEFMEIMKVF